MVKPGRVEEIQEHLENELKRIDKETKQSSGMINMAIVLAPYQATALLSHITALEQERDRLKEELHRQIGPFAKEGE